MPVAVERLDLDAAVQHGPNATVQIMFETAFVSGAVAERDDHVAELAANSGGDAPPEAFGGTPVPSEDAAFDIHDDHRIQRCIEHRSKTGVEIVLGQHRTRHGAFLTVVVPVKPENIDPKLSPLWGWLQC